VQWVKLQRVDGLLEFYHHGYQSRSEHLEARRLDARPGASAVVWRARVRKRLARRAAILNCATPHMSPVLGMGCKRTRNPFSSTENGFLHFCAPLRFNLPTIPSQNSNAFLSNAFLIDNASPFGYNAKTE
jgi:hypothetical protein